MNKMIRLFFLVLGVCGIAAGGVAQAGMKAEMLHCQSHFFEQNLDLILKQEGRESEYQIIILGLEKALIRFTREVSIHVGQPNTRLAGLTLYSADLWGSFDLSLTMRSEPISADPMIFTGSGSLDYQGKKIHLKCVVL